MMQSHRISTNIGQDQLVTVELKQDYDLLEILSLKFSQQDVYTSLCSDYGVVCGRISVNNGLGIPNARVSIFVPLKDVHVNDPVISALYPYTSITDKDQNNYRYNLLPARQQHSGHSPTGTFPDQEDILTREEILEVYENYYSYTVKTNNAGDFMIWGVPLGQQTIHVDVDLSDIGCFSLRPYDFIRQGKGVDNFKNKYTFKPSEDLNSLPQIVSFDKMIEVYPFWGNVDLCDIGITRTDFDLSDKGIKIQPKAFLMGGIFTDVEKNSVNKNCTPRQKMGRKCDMKAKSAKIEALRYTPQKNSNNLPIIEEVDLHEDVPDDGSFVFPLDMNMDYLFTNEFGENEITNDPNKGVPTSACYRLRFNMNDNGLDRVRANADYLVPNIREYNNEGVIDDSSYYFGTEWSGYPQNAISLMTDSLNGEYYPKDYFYRFNYNKVYTVSSFHSHFIGTNAIGTVGFANINEAHPSEEEDCGDKLTPPTNFGKKNYTFTLLIADFLLGLDFVIKFLTLQFLNFVVLILNTVIELLITVTSGGRGLRDNLDEFQINNTTKLSLINYPECIECSSETSTVGGGTNNNQFYSENGCSFYDLLYDESLATGYFIADSTNTNHYTGCDTADHGYGPDVGPSRWVPANIGRKYVPTLVGLTDYIIISTAIYADGTHRPADPVNKQNAGNASDFGPLSTGVRDIGCHGWGYQGGPVTPSGRSEFRNGVFYIIPGTQTPAKLTGVLLEWYRRKRVGTLFCGGIVNYGFMDNWLSGSLYFPQLKIKKLSRAVQVGAEGIAHYCRNIARLVVGQGKLYYRSASFDGTNFDPNNLNRPTTFVDLGPRDEFIKEICVDQTLDPNCSVARSIGQSSYHDLGELLGLAINYRMDIAGADGSIDLFFQNTSFFTDEVLDGDILQLLSINNETGIEGFDLENPRYVGYQFNHLDPKLNQNFFKVNGDYGPLPVTLELNEDGYRIRTCLNEGTHYDFNTPSNLVEGRLTESSQPVPFYLWNKKGEGFGNSGTDKNNQSWDYSTVELQPLQGMTYGYNITGLPNNDSDQYALLPMTNNNSGLTISNLNITDQVEFETILNVDKGPLEDEEYPGFTYLYVTGGTVNGVTGLISPNDANGSGVLYIRVGPVGYNSIDGVVVNGWQTIQWNTNFDIILPERYDYYSGNNYRQILSTPFQFYFGLIAGKTGLDKFIDLFGPKGAFPPIN